MTIILKEKNTDDFVTENEEQTQLLLNSNFATAKIFSSLDRAFQVKELINGQQTFGASADFDVYLSTIKKGRFEFELVERMPNHIDENKILFALIGRPCDAEKLLTKTIGATEFTYKPTFVRVKYNSKSAYNTILITKKDDSEFILSVIYFNKMDEFLKYNKAIRQRRDYTVTLETIKQIWDDKIGLDLDW